MIGELSTLAQHDIVVVVYVEKGSDEYKTTYLFNNQMSNFDIDEILLDTIGDIEIISIVR